jgi:hypothetical protein
MENLIGKTFNQLTVIGVDPVRINYKTKLICKCSCGNTRSIESWTVTSGTTKSCGCLWLKSITKHNAYGTPLYKIWQTMRGRCQETKGKKFPHYKGRGIKVCERWSDFNNFYADMIPTYIPGLTIERKNVNGDYEPSNCCWIPKSEQGDNKTNTWMVDSPWGRISVKKAAELAGISIATIKGRCVRKVPYDQMFVPLKSKGQVKRKLK